jgi:hypothetical protein
MTWHFFVSSAAIPSTDRAMLAGDSCRKSMVTDCGEFVGLGCSVESIVDVVALKFKIECQRRSETAGSITLIPEYITAGE